MKITKRLASWAETGVNIAKRLVPWAETAAKFWAAYWLLILGSFLILGSVLLKWVQYPISSNLSGLELPLFHGTGVIPHVALLSFGALGLVVLIAGVVLLRFFVSALSLAAAVLITLCVLTPPIIGQHYFNSGSIAKARGHNQEAIADYRKAMKWDAWHAQDIDLYATIGDLQKQSGIENNSPERHISRAVELQMANEYGQAIFEFSRAAEAGGVLAVAVRRESAKTRIALGLA